MPAIDFLRNCVAIRPLLLSPLLTLFLALFPLLAVSAPAPVIVLNLNGAISPVLADYAIDGIARAKDQQAQLVVLTMDTPGGLDTSMRLIIKAILASPVPVATFVYPSGARAASAGTFILYASHIAAMSPGTNLGAATPIAIGGQSGSTDARHDKAVNDAAAYIRSLAELRGRNVEWAEQAVRAAMSLSAEAAHHQQVIDLIASDVGELLKKLDGHYIQLPDRKVQLHLRGAPVQSFEQNWRVRMLAVMTDPGIALMLVLIGLAGLFLEFSTPGMILPGIAGGISLLLGLYALQLLPVNFAGLALLALGVSLLLAEAFLPSGILGIGGVIAMVIGALILTNSSQWQGSAIPAAAMVTLAVFIAVSIAVLANLALRSRRQVSVVGDNELIGMAAEIIDDTPGNSWAELHGERWQVNSTQPFRRGELVRVISRQGLILEVISPETLPPNQNQHKGT